MDCDKAEREGALTPLKSDGGPRPDEIFAALADYRRRCALYYLDEEGQATLDDVAQQIVAWEHEVPTDDVPDELIEEVKVELYHNHLPRLNEADIVEYDQRSAMLVYREPPELVEQCLKYCADEDLPDNYSEL